MNTKRRWQPKSNPRSEPIPDAIAMQPPARVRIGADRFITHELVDMALREYRAKGKRIRRVRMEMQRVPQQVRGGRAKEFKASGFHEVDLAEDEQLARSGT